MQNGARFFAYSTWVIMISLAIIIFSDRFLEFIADPGWAGLITLLAIGFVYLNFSYLSIKRYMRKALYKTFLHYVLVLMIFLPAGFWVTFMNDEIKESWVITVIVLAFSCILGGYYGSRAGQREKYKYEEKLEDQQMHSNE